MLDPKQWVVALYGDRDFVGKVVEESAEVLRLEPAFELKAIIGGTQAEPVFQHIGVPIVGLASFADVRLPGWIARKRVSDLSKEDQGRILRAIEAGATARDRLRLRDSGLVVGRV